MEDPKLDVHRHPMSKRKKNVNEENFERNKCTLVILILEGAGGAPGKHVLNAAASLHGP